MPDYRLCFLNEAGGHAATTEFSAANDEQARLMSEDAVGDSRAQLWRKCTLIASYPHEGPD